VDPPKYTVTVSGGTPISTTGVTGTNIMLVPGAAPAGQQFKQWDVTGGGELHGNLFIIGTSNATITAVWEPIPTYTVTVTGGTPASTTGTAGTVITLVPGTAPEGQKFKQWSYTGSGTLAGNVFTIGAGNATVTAVWEDIHDDSHGGLGDDLWLVIVLMVATLVIIFLFVFFFVLTGSAGSGKKEEKGEEEEKEEEH